MYLIRGNMDMPFGLLSLAFTMLYEFPMLSAYDGGALETRIAALTPITSCKPQHEGMIKIHSLLSNGPTKVHSLQATEMKDHIYALLGIFSDVDRLGIKVDDSKPSAELLIQGIKSYW